MSLTLHVLDAGQQVALALPRAAGGSSGILDWINAKSLGAEAVLKNVAALVAVVFIMWRSWAAKGALTAILVGAISAAVFLWIVNNVSVLQNRVATEVNGLRAPAVHLVVVPDPATPAHRAGPGGPVV